MGRVIDYQYDDTSGQHVLRLAATGDVTFYVAGVQHYLVPWIEHDALDDAPAAAVDDDHAATRVDDVAAIIEQLARVATLNARTATLLGDTLAHVAALRAAGDEMT